MNLAKKIGSTTEMRKWVSVTSLLAMSAVLLSGCATLPTSSIGEENGRLVLADSFIGEDYEVVMARAAQKYSVEPQCESRRLGLQKQRKAFHYEVCGFNPVKQRFSDAPLSEVVYHFLGRELVRVDVRAEGESELLASVKQDIASLFGSSESTQVTIGENSYEWTARQHVAGVRAAAGPNAGNVQVRLLDERLLDSAPWLTSE